MPFMNPLSPPPLPPQPTIKRLRSSNPFEEATGEQESPSFLSLADPPSITNSPRSSEEFKNQTNMFEKKPTISPGTRKKRKRRSSSFDELPFAFLGVQATGSPRRPYVNATELKRQTKTQLIKRNGKLFRQLFPPFLSSQKKLLDQKQKENPTRPLIPQEEKTKPLPKDSLSGKTVMAR